MNYGEKKSTSLSAFVTSERKSGATGFGAAWTQRGRETADLSFADLGDFRLYQFSKLAPKQVGPYSVDFGFTIAYADPKEDLLDTPKDVLTGISVIYAKTELMMGMSLDLRVSSLSSEFNPLAWFTDPDVLWLGAGLSYTF